MVWRMETSKPLPLWESGAPGISSATPCQVPTITPYSVAGAALRPAIVVCPGGGYGHLAPHEGGPIAEWLDGIGIAGFVCHYRVAPYRDPWPATDARRAIRWVRHHAARYGVDPTRVGILGFSAGGHLAAYASTHGADPHPEPRDAIDAERGRPDCAVLCYPVISFESWGHIGSARNLLGREPTADDHREFSNHLHVDGDTPPTFLWHTADDAGVSVENSLRHALACRAANVPCELHSFPSGPHGLGLAPKHPHVAQWSALCANWLAQLGWRAAT